MTKTSKLTPTSSLPFAANVCDVPYLDLVENGCKPAIDELAKRVGVLAPSVLFAELTNENNRQLQGWLDVLKTVESDLKWAHRGGIPSGLSAVGCFLRARSMLSLAIGQIEVMTDNAEANLDNFCESEQAS